MKRFSDGNMGGPYKRSRLGPDDVEVRLLIPSKVAGSIIGKGGKNISRLRSDFKASVTVPDCPGPERILTVSAPEVETVMKVIQEILSNLEDTTGRSKSADDVDIRMLVHQSQAGCIIGKGGLKVKELREKTGARIKIYTSCCPQSTDRVVQITGRGNTVDCVQEMVELLKTVAVKGADNPYDPINFDDVYADDYGGYGSSMGGRGGGGGGGMGMGRDMGGPPMGREMGGGRDMGRGRPAPFGGPPSRGPSSMGGPPPRGGFGGGGFGGGGGGSRNGFDGPPTGVGRGGMRMNGPRNNGPGLRHNGSGLRNDGPGPFGPQDCDDSSGPTKSQVTIPSDLAGAIIGRAGVRIQRIRSESGAGITIEEALPGSTDRVITISGLPNQIQMAQYLLQRSVHENTKRSHNTA